MNHDQNFKNLILDYPHQALAFFATEEATDQVSDAEVIPVRQEQLKDRLGDRFRELDIPLMVKWPDGRREALLFVLEEESDPRRFSIHRLVHYCLDLGVLCKTDRVVPVVIFLRGQAPRRELVFGTERRTYLSFNFIVCELDTIAYERFRDSDNIVARLNLPNMRYAPGRKLDAYAQAVSGLANLEDDPKKQLKYIDFIDTYGDLDENERASYKREYPQEAKIMMSFSERFIEQGRQEARREMEGFTERFIEQGRLEGKQEGEAMILMRLLQLKFGSVPEAVHRKIERADPQMLLAWSERVLTAAGIEQVISD
ncbi:hypothetical protein [Candidatus Thiosymbion oneisti]|uniref:hypothetical protein n=1 Tax=Candidatus Thiosymbion oneisti TaxID=589554 RepID=UPI00105CF9BD|nr:hypothetical protein [Candidatus Thiosymbion oneisti]